MDGELADDRLARARRARRRARRGPPRRRGTPRSGSRRAGSRAARRTPRASASVAITRAPPWGSRRCRAPGTTSASMGRSANVSPSACEWIPLASKRTRRARWISTAGWVMCVPGVDLGEDPEERRDRQRVDDHDVEEPVGDVGVGAHAHAAAERRRVGDRHEHRARLDAAPVELDGIRDGPEDRQLAQRPRGCSASGPRGQRHPLGPRVDDGVEAGAEDAAEPRLPRDPVGDADRGRSSRVRPSVSSATAAAGVADRQAEVAGEVVAGAGRDDGERASACRRTRLTPRWTMPSPPTTTTRVDAVEPRPPGPVPGPAGSRCPTRRRPRARPRGAAAASASPSARPTPFPDVGLTIRATRLGHTRTLQGGRLVVGDVQPVGLVLLLAPVEQEGDADRGEVEQHHRDWRGRAWCRRRASGS